MAPCPRTDLSMGIRLLGRRHHVVHAGAAHAVDRHVERHGDDGRQEDAGFPAAVKLVRQRLDEVGRHQRNEAETHRNRHDEQVVAVGLEIDVGEDARPVAATMPNITSPAPPSTTTGTASTSAAILGKSPSRSMMTPPATVTQRERTPVTPTRPTFCEKEV